MAAGAPGCRESSSSPNPAQSTPPPQGAPSPPRADSGLPAHRGFSSAELAIRDLLARHPRVIGFGEFHQTEATHRVRSTLARFNETILPELAGHTQTFLLETWADYGNCDQTETAVGAAVKRDTERPASTETDITAALRRSRELGIAPRVLPFDCSDYRSLLQDDGQVDYERLLQLITARLRDQALAALDSPSATLAIYGGATHNDRYPYESTADLSYAAAVAERVDNRYLEVDLYVPEFVEGNPLLMSEPWYPLLEQPSNRESFVLIERGPDSFILLLPRT